MLIVIGIINCIMSAHSKIILFTVCYLIFAGCCSKTISDRHDDRATQSARKMLESYSADINSEGFLAEFKYLDSSEHFWWLPPGFDSPITYDSVAAILKRNAVLFPKVNVKYDSLQLLPAGSSTVIYKGDVTVILTDTTGRMDTTYLKEDGKIVRRPGGWKLMCGKTVFKE